MKLLLRHSAFALANKIVINQSLSLTLPWHMRQRSAARILLGTDAALTTSISASASGTVRQGKPSTGVRVSSSCALRVSRHATQRQHHQHQTVRLCCTTRSRSEVHLGRISNFSLLQDIHIIILSLVLLQVTSRWAAGLTWSNFLFRCSCSPR